MPRKKANSFKEQEVGGPPKDDGWIWHCAALRFSAAWRGRSTALMRLLDLLEEDLLRCGRHTNGELMALYDDLMRRGISRGMINKVIAEGVERKLIEVRQPDVWPRPNGSKQAPNLFRLTYQPTATTDAKGVITWHRETNEWRYYVEPERPKRRTFKRTLDSRLNDPELRPKTDLPSTKDGTEPVPKTVLGKNGKLRKTAKSRVPKTVLAPGTKDGTAYTIYPEGTGGTDPPPRHADADARADPGIGYRCPELLPAADGRHVACGRAIGRAGLFCAEHQK